MLRAFVNAVVYTGSEIVTGKAVITDGNRIKKLVDKASVPADAEVIDCGGNNLAPGLIDLQISGGGGYLFSSHPSLEALKGMTESIVNSGTTSFLIGIPTNSFELYREAIRIVKSNPDPAVLGLHLEGPYINPLRRGAHVKKFIKQPDEEEIKSLLKDSGGVVRMMTLAPEICSPEIIKLLTGYGIVLSAGHSNATYAEAVNGYHNGIATTTHLFNGMSQLHHRDPGLPGAAIETENAHAAIIADGIHVNFHVVSIAKRLMKERLFLVTDAVEEDKNGDYLHIRQEDRFTLPDGTLSGSMLTMLKAVRNCVEKIGITMDEALRMASLYPAEIMKISDRGRIEPGYATDLLVFGRNFEVSHVCVNGALKSF